MGIAELVLEYLKVILSGPVLGTAVAVAFLTLFRSEISRLIDRIKTIKGPGGVHLELQQKKDLEKIPGQKDPIETAEVELPKSIEITPEQANKVVQLLKSEKANAYLWEYRYLNYYLVRSTQLVLDWVGTQQTVSLRFLDSYLQPSIPDVNERNAILEALKNHHLITVVGDVVQITPKGREYLQWRGPLPPIGAA